MALTGYSYSETGSNACNALASAEAPRTIASAVGKVDALTDRLFKTRAQLEGLSETIGGPRPVAGGISISNVKAQQSGILFRLNDGVESAHSVIDDIEGLLAGISRSLG